MRMLALLVASVFAIACTDARAQGIVQSAGNGRFQIVNGTPEFGYNIMLLDTQTGRTWLNCTVDSSRIDVIVFKNWCEMKRQDLLPSK